jgi:hypothetical protein
MRAGPVHSRMLDYDMAEIEAALRGENRVETGE